MKFSIKGKFKQILKHGLIYGLTSSLQSLLSYILIPILAVYMSAEEFGVYSLLLVMGSFASAIFYFGASSALGRYYYEENSEVYRKQIISSAMQITVFGAVLLIVIATLFAAVISRAAFQTEIYTSHIRFAFYGVAFSFLLNLFTLILRYDEQLKLFMVTTIISVLVNVSITYVLLAKYNYGVEAPLIGTLSANLLCFLFLMIYKIKCLSFKFNLKYSTVLLKFGIPILISSLLYYVLDLADRFIIKNLLDITAVGIYSLGYKIGSVVNILLIVPFSLVWAPMRMQYANDLDAARQLMVKVTSYIMIIGFVIILMAIFFSRILMPIFFKKEEFLESAQIVPIVITGIFLFGLQNILDFGINYYKKLHFYVITSIIGIVFNLIVNYTFIPIFGYKAAAYTTMFTYLLTTSLIFIFSSKFFKVRLEWERFMKPLLYLICMLVLFNFYPYFFENILLSICLFVITLLWIYQFWLTQNEKSSVWQGLKNLEKQ